MRCDEKVDKNIDFSHDFSAIGSREAIDLIGFLRNARYDLDKRRKILSANVLNFVLPRLERLSPTEHRVLPARLSDFAEKLCFLALGSEDRSNRSVL